MIEVSLISGTQRIFVARIAHATALSGALYRAHKRANSLAFFLNEENFVVDVQYIH